MEKALDGGAFAIVAADLQGGADFAGAIIHDTQAHALVRLDLFGEFDAVVGDQEAMAFAHRPEGDENLFRLAVFDGVVDGFLGDAIEVGGGGVVVNEDGLIASEPAIDLENSPDIGGQLLQGGHQAVGVEFDGGKATREAAGMGDGFADVAGDFACAFGLDFGFGGQILLEDLAHEFNAGESLAQAVVQVLADALLFTIADFEDFLFEAFAFGDIDAGSDDELEVAVGVEQDIIRPGDEPAFLLAGEPVIFVLAGNPAGAEPLESGLHRFEFLGDDEQVPELPGPDFGEGITGGLFTGAVETNDASLTVEHDHEGAGSVEHGGDEGVFLFQGRFRGREPFLFLQMAERAPDHGGEEFLELDILDEVIERATLHHFDSHTLVALAGDDDEREGPLDFGEVCDQFLAFDVLKFQIEKQEVGRMPLEPGD